MVSLTVATYFFSGGASGFTQPFTLVLNGSTNTGLQNAMTGLKLSSLRASTRASFRQCRWLIQ